MLRRHLEQGERQSDLRVEVPRRAVGRQRTLQHGGDGLFGARLADAAGDADDQEMLEAGTPPGRQALQSSYRFVDNQEGQLRIQVCISPVATYEPGYRARRRGVADEFMPVEAFAAHGNKEITGLCLSRIAFNPGKDGFDGNFATDHRARAGEDVLQREGSHGLAPVVDSTGASRR